MDIAPDDDASAELAASHERMAQWIADMMGRDIADVRAQLNAMRVDSAARNEIALAMLRIEQEMEPPRQSGDEQGGS